MDRGANVSAVEQGGATALHKAAEGGHSQIIMVDRLHIALFDAMVDSDQILIQNGAHTDAVNKEGQTPLHLASLNGQGETVEVRHRDRSCCLIR